MIDFIDIGSSKGGSVRYASKYGKGYGIDIDPEKCKKAQSLGYDVRLMDIFEIKEKSRWVTCMHVLEHLKSRKDIKDMIQKMSEIATEGVYITFPYFDSDSYLFDHGLRFFWSRWVGHTYHLSRLELHNILNDLELTYDLECWGQVNHSSDKSIVPLNAPVDVLGYSEEMGEKPQMNLTDVFKEVRCTIYDL